MDSRAQPLMSDALDQMWSRFLPQLEERVATLEAAAATFAAGSLPADQQAAATAAAHKLAGVLGTFGLTEGTLLARELEKLYSCQSRPDPAAGTQLTALTAQLRAVVDSRNQPPSPRQQLHFG
jgi:HPt (histidine-containing phosphotransfer) domain-containing protein